MKAVIGIVLVVVISVGGFMFFSGGGISVSENNGQKNLETTKRADTLPNATLQNRNGSSVTIHEAIGGAPAVINSWATWCPFCIDELPDFVELQVKYNTEIKVIAVNRGESVARAEGYLTDLSVENGMTYLYDNRDTWYRAIGGFSMPETLFVNSDGVIVLHKRGFMTFSEMDKIVSNQLLSN